MASRLPRPPFFVNVFCGTLAALVLAVAAPTALAQQGGTIAGTVVDPSGQPVPEAIVMARAQVGPAQHAATDARGQFQLPGLPAGTYHLTVALEGFRADAVTAVVEPGRTASVTIGLRLSALSEALVVSASYVDTPLSESPAGTTVLTRRDLDSRQLVTVADALSLTSGAAVSANGGAGAVTSLFSRGGESDFTLVLVDGVKVNSFGGGFDLGHLTTAGLSSIEVVRGPQSAVFGADAIGGVVQLRTGLGGRPAVSAALESGGYGSSRFMAGTRGSAGHFSWGASLDRLSSDGWTDTAPASGEPVTNDDYEGLTAAVSGAWDPSARVSLRVDARVATNERGYPGPFGSNPIGAFPGVDTVSRGRNEMRLATVSLVRQWTPATTVRARGSWMSLESDFTSAFGDAMSRTRRWSAHAQVDHAFAPWFDATAGLDLAGERADSTYITGPAFEPVPIERRVDGYFVEARARAGSRLAVTGGLRLEHIVREDIPADPWGWTPRPELSQDSILSPNPRVAASYYLRTSNESQGNWSRVHASAGTGIRAPDAFELAFTDHPGLKPERSRSLDAGFEQALVGGRLVVDGTLFANRYDDLIVAVGPAFADASRYRTDNIANAEAWGVEVTGAWRAARGLDARVAYSFVDTEVLAIDRSDGAAPSPFEVGDPLIRRPRHQVAASLAVVRPRWGAFARVTGRGRVLDVEPNYGAFGGLFRAAGYTVAGVGGSVRVGRYLEILARIENVLDQAYESALGFPAPRRTATIGLRLAAGQ